MAGGIDYETIRHLYETYGFFVHRRCERLLGSAEEADDALQEVFIRVLRNRRKLDDKESLLPWLNRVTTHHCLNQLRKRRVRKHDALTALETRPNTDAEALQLLVAQRQLVAPLVARANRQTRHVVIAYFFDDQRVETIAENLSISVPTVRRRIKEFLRQARKTLSKIKLKDAV